MPINNIPDTPRRLVKIPAPDVSGKYFFPVLSANPSASNTLGNNNLRVYPFILSTLTTIDRIGAEILAVVGEAGSKLRLGIYADNGRCVPGSLILDAGQLDGTSATVQELAITPLQLDPGIYWIGGVVQSAPTTQPNVRSVNSSLDDFPFILSGPVGVNQGICGYNMAGVSAGLPTDFVITSTIGAAPRIFFRGA